MTTSVARCGGCGESVSVGLCSGRYIHLEGRHEQEPNESVYLCTPQCLFDFARKKIKMELNELSVDFDLLYIAALDVLEASEEPGASITFDNVEGFEAMGRLGVVMGMYQPFVSGTTPDFLEP